MKKLRLILFFLLLIIAVTVSAYSKDHFEGSWVGLASNNVGNDIIIKFDIQKNGDDYLVSNTIYQAPLNDNNSKSSGQVSDSWNKFNTIINADGSAKNNVLNIKTETKTSITYDENEKRLHIPMTDQYSSAKLDRDDNGEKLKGLKKQIEDNVQKSLHNRYPELTYHIVDN